MIDFLISWATAKSTNRDVPLSSACAGITFQKKPTSKKRYPIDHVLLNNYDQVIEPGYHLSVYTTHALCHNVPAYDLDKYIPLNIYLPYLLVPRTNTPVSQLGLKCHNQGKQRVEREIPFVPCALIARSLNLIWLCTHVIDPQIHYISTCVHICTCCAYTEASQKVTASKWCNRWKSMWEESGTSQSRFISFSVVTPLVLSLILYMLSYADLGT